MTDAMAPTVGAFIEIVERQKQPVNPGDIIIPNEVRINGQALYVSADDPVVVERISTEALDAVRVTLTLLAHRVEIKQEQVEG
jgi:hypothetical protein